MELRGCTLNLSAQVGEGPGLGAHMTRYVVLTPSTHVPTPATPSHTLPHMSTLPPRRAMARHWALGPLLGSGVGVVGASDWLRCGKCGFRCWGPQGKTAFCQGVYWHARGMCVDFGGFWRPLAHPSPTGTCVKGWGAAQYTHPSLVPWVATGAYVRDNASHNGWRCPTCM